MRSAAGVHQRRERPRVRGPARAVRPPRDRPGAAADLQRTVRDLVAISALAELLLGESPVGMAKLFVDALVGIIRCEAVYVRIRDLDGSQIEHHRTLFGTDSGASWHVQFREWIGPYLNMGERGCIHDVVNPFDDGRLRLCALDIGVNGEFGVVSVGGARPSFPDAVDRTLLDAAVAQLYVALRAARTQTALITSEERHRLTAEIASDYSTEHVVSEDGSLDLVYASEGFTRITGYTPQELRLDRRVPLIHPDDVWIVRDATARLLRGETVRNHLRFTTKAGEVRHVRFISRPRWNADGTRVERVLSAVSDETQTMLAERALREARDELERRVAQRTADLLESEQRFRQIAETISEVFWVHDLDDDRITFVSREYESVFGRSRDSLDKDPSSFLEAIYPDDRARVVAAMDRQRQGVDLDETYRVVHPDGALRWVRDRGFPLRDADGRVYRVVGIAQDVTDVHMAMDALRESERRFSVAFHCNPSLQAISRLDDGCFIDVNRAFLERFGLTREEVIGRSQAEVGIMPDKAWRRWVERRLHKAAPLRSHELVATTKRGDRIRLLVFVELIELAGEHCILSSAYDITERKLAQQQLDASLAQMRALTGHLMQAQDEERRRIARQLHETTAQQLAALKMNLAVLQRQSSAADGEQRQVLEEAVVLADRCMADVRTLSYVLHPPFLDEAGLASALRWYGRGFAKRSGISVELDLPKDLPRLPQEIETTLFRIVQESLINIYRHAESATAAIRLQCRRRDLILEIIDRGHGMRARPADHDADESVAGVGIAGMRERTRQLGGRLELDSGPNGTTVRAMLPVGMESGRDHPPNPDRR